MTTLPVDQIVISANEHPLYLDFWPAVAWAYRCLFPNVQVTLAFLSERREDDPFVARLRAHGDVVLVRPVRKIPQAAQTKMVRYWVAARQGDGVCYIDDADWIPINRDWYIEKVQQRKPGTLLFVGPEVYGAKDGQCPASMTVATGTLFKQLFNPDNLPYNVWIHSLEGRTGKHQDIRSRVQHEGMSCTTDQEHLNQWIFSDEAFIVQLRKERPVPTSFVERGYEPGKDTIDRSWWEDANRQKLASGGYLGAHAARPYRMYRHGIETILGYLYRTYGWAACPPPPPLILPTPQVDPDMEFGGSGMMREAFEWICWNIPAGASILELGSGYVSTNYLSRYFNMITIEDDPIFLNIYPAHYIHAPLVNGWYDLARVREGLDHRRIWEQPYQLLIVDGPSGSEPRRGFLDHLDLFSFRQPVMVDDIDRPTERAVVQKVSELRRRSPRIVGQAAVI